MVRDFLRDILHSQFGKNKPNPLYPIDRKKFNVTLESIGKLELETRLEATFTMSNHIEDLQNRYKNLYPNEGCLSKKINKIESVLDVTLPKSFREIASFFRGGYLGGISHFSFIDDVNPNIIQETLRLRDSVNLPHEFIVLAEPPESLIVMNTVNTPSVIWFSGVEISNLPQKTFTSPPDEWETYSDFFEEFLTEEEEEQDY